MRQEWHALEVEIDGRRKHAEASARAASVAGDPEEASRTLTHFMEHTVNEVVARARALRASLVA